MPHIVLRGAEWFRAIGPEKSPGPKLYCVSGHVVRPGVYELPMGTPLREIIYEHAGGIPNGRELKAVIPGGASMPPFTPAEIDVPMDMDSVAEGGLVPRLRRHHGDGRHRSAWCGRCTA